MPDDKKPKESQTFINLGIVLNSKGEVMVIRRKKVERFKTGSILSWAFPGGKQHLDESRKKCIEREVMAETGYEIEAEKEISIRVPPEQPVLLVYHLCRLIQQKPVGKPQQPWEVEEIRWIRPGELKNLFTSSLDPKVAEELKI